MAEIDWKAELIGAAIFSAGALVLLGLAELLRHLKVHPEVSRKFAHMGSGLLVLTFPSLFRSPLTVMGLALMFFVVMAGGRLLGQLRSIHGVARVSLGAYVFPLVVALLFYLSHGDALLFQIPILVLAISDALAALIGSSYGAAHFSSMGDRRSLEGSAAFFVSAFLVVHLPLLLSARTGRLEAVLIAASAAALVTAFEAVSVRGLDNFFIPYGAFFSLDHYLRYPLQDLWKRVAVIGVSVVIIAAIVRLRLLRASGAIGVGLCAYAAFALGGPAWLGVMLIPSAVVIVGMAVLAHRRPTATSPELSDMAPFGIPAMAVVLLHDFTHSGRWLLPYLAAVSGATAVAVVVLLTGGNRPPSSGRRLAVGAAAALGAVAPFLLGPAFPTVSARALGLAALAGLASALAYGAMLHTVARFTCATCREVTAHAVHCGEVGAAVSGRGHWTRARLIWVVLACSTAVTAVATFI